MRHLIVIYLALFSCFTAAEETIKKERHQDDPTKVITKIGIGYTDELSISGSLALDQTRKINARTNVDASEWSFGGSWLFDLGILNFSLKRSEYNDGGHKNTYSIGSYLPLNVLGVDTGEWMVFPMAGFNHNSGESVVKENTLVDNVVMQQNTSNGGYIGAFVLRPITEHWSFLGFTGGGMGSSDYSNIWGGGGLSYKINTHHSFNLFGFISDDNFGRISKLGLNYTYEFK